MNRPSSKHLLFATLLLLVAISPFIELRAIDHFIPARWSDSYSPWYGAKVALQGVNPYSDQVTRDIQKWFYGHTLDPVHPEFDLQAFVYPATAIPLFAVSTLLPWKTLRLLFFAVAPLLVFLSCFYWVTWSGVARNRTTQLGVAVLATASVPSFWGIHLMQPTVIIFAGVAAVMALLSFNRYAWAGALLGCLSIKPNLVALLTLWLLIVMVRQRRWRFIVSFGVVFTTLSAIAEWLVPAWPWKWYHAAINYTHHKLPIFGFVFGHYSEVVTLAAGVLLLIALYKVGFPHPRSRQFGLAVSMILAYTVCVIPSGPWMVYNQIFLIPPILFLASITGSSAVAPIMRTVALGFAWLTILSVPICAALLLLRPPSEFSIRFPFSNYLLPISVLIAVLLFSWDNLDPRTPATPPAARSSDQPPPPSVKEASTPATP